MSELEPIITLKNQYRGVNPHLQDNLLETGDDPTIWPSFHADHMTHITEFLNQQLPKRYRARTEQSLQIRINDFTADARIRKPIPDVAIYRRPIQSSGAGLPAPEAMITFEYPLEDSLDPEEDFMRAVVIHELATHGKLGRAVARIELLSPSNKPNGSGYPAYRRGRMDALHSGTPLIEIDYIHEQPPTVFNYPIYPNMKNSYAYNIFVSDPRPRMHEGKVQVYAFDVDSPIPVVKLPLANDETFNFDFNPVYQYTFERGLWGEDHVDYRQPPLRMETYSPADQTRIQQRMAAVAEAHAQGIDLEQ